MVVECENESSGSEGEGSHPKEIRSHNKINYTEGSKHKFTRT